MNGNDSWDGIELGHVNGNDSWDGIELGQLTLQASGAEYACTLGTVDDARIIGDRDRDLLV